MVLQGVVTIKVLSLVEISNRLVIVIRVNNSVVFSIISMRITIDSKLA